MVIKWYIFIYQREEEKDLNSRFFRKFASQSILTPFLKTSTLILLLQVWDCNLAKILSLLLTKSSNNFESYFWTQTVWDKDCINEYSGWNRAYFWTEDLTKTDLRYRKFEIVTNENTQCRIRGFIWLSVSEQSLNSRTQTRHNFTKHVEVVKTRAEQQNNTTPGNQPL